MNLWVAIYRFAWSMLAVLLVLGVGCLFYPPVKRFNDLKQREARLDEETRFQEAMLRHLKNKQERLLTDSRFVERIARDELGLSKPGEIIYKVADPRTPAEATPPRR